MDSGADPDSLDVTPELLADLQAGLLDDATAARVRRHARTHPDAARMLARLDAVRHELAHLGSDEGTAAEVPAAVTARVGAALRTAPHPGLPARDPAVRRPALTRTQRMVLILGLCAVSAAIIIGAVMLIRDAKPGFSAGPLLAGDVAETVLARP